MWGMGLTITNITEDCPILLKLRLNRTDFFGLSFLACLFWLVFFDKGRENLI